MIPDFECTDLDNNLLSYSLIQSPDESAFDIDAHNRLKVKGIQNTCLSFEREFCYKFDPEIKTF